MACERILTYTFKSYACTVFIVMSQSTEDFMLCQPLLGRMGRFGSILIGDFNTSEVQENPRTQSKLGFRTHAAICAERTTPIQNPLGDILCKDLRVITLLSMKDMILEAESAIDPRGNNTV